MFDNIFEYIFLIGLIIGFAIRAIYIRRPKPASALVIRKISWERPAMAMVFCGMQVIPIIYLLTAWLDFADYHLPQWAGWIGVAVFAGALLLLWRSHADLGRNFSPLLQIKPEHSLVTQGVYRYIRHPMYLAHWLWAIAQGLLLQNWIAGFAFLATFIVLYTRRIPREEQMMLDSFPQEYRAYMNRTGRLIPRLPK